ncbi:MAG: DnaA N-terminal domain-containing protein [Prevotella sp.]|nr:DnaA N-terminal domain-containing protein [Prevotella sp.]
MEDYHWIGLFRKFDTCSFYNDSNAVQMYLYLFLNARREDLTLSKQITMRGQLRTSIKYITEWLKITRKSARKSLEKLRDAGVIHIENLRRNGILITIREFSKLLSLENIRGGWVKLYYDIRYEDIFYNAKMLHVYLHILLHSYAEGENFEDPKWFRMNKISGALGLSIAGVKDCLKKLRKSGILNIGYDGQKKIESLQLLEFSDYLKEKSPKVYIERTSAHALPTQKPSPFADLFEEAVEIKDDEKAYENRGIKTSQKTAKSGLKKSQENSLPNHQETFTKNFVNHEITDDYRDKGTKVGQKWAKKGSKENAENSLPNAYDGSYTREPIIKENRDIRIENINYNNNSPIQKFSSVEELLQDKEWVISMLRLYDFKSEQALCVALNLFLEDLKCRKEKTPTELKNFLDYFINWYKRNEKRLQAAIKKNLPDKANAQSLWKECVSAFEQVFSKDVFENIFKKISFDSYIESDKTLFVQIPNREIYEILESKYIRTLGNILKRFFGAEMRLCYRLAQR